MDYSRRNLSSVQEQNSGARYLQQAYGPVFVALQQAGDTAGAVAIAEKVLAKDQSNEDMLLVVANHNLGQKTEPDKVLAYSGKMIELMNTKPKPEGVADADWEKKKTTIVGLGHWMSGMIYYGQNKFPETDKSLRAALPYIKGNDQLLAPALFHLGVANYKMGNIVEAIKFNEQCAAIKGPYAGPRSEERRVGQEWRSRRSP